MTGDTVNGSARTVTTVDEAIAHAQRVLAADAS